MAIWLGTSGFSYKEWKGIFYPKELAAAGFLKFYASRFRGVEIDSTFYRMPKRETLQAWAEATPETFRFALKASQRITHFGRLKLPSEALDYWLGILPELGSRLGLALYQLPPNFKCDLPRLEAFLQTLASAPIKSAFEFRHESWFVPEVYACLRKYETALCINEGDDGTTPMELTAPRTYVRLRKSAYTAEERSAWQERLRGWSKDGIDVFAFIKHEDNPDAPTIALEFQRGLE
jgi:uncharacterized protein YecE (DUF72 family)